MSTEKDAGWVLPPCAHLSCSDDECEARPNKEFHVVTYGDSDSAFRHEGRWADCAHPECHPPLGEDA